MCVFFGCVVIVVRLLYLVVGRCRRRLLLSCVVVARLFRLFDVTCCWLWFVGVCCSLCVVVVCWLLLCVVDRRCVVSFVIRCVCSSLSLLLCYLLLLAVCCWLALLLKLFVIWVLTVVGVVGCCLSVLFVACLLLICYW